MSSIAETIARKKGKHRHDLVADMGLFGKERPERGGMDDEDAADGPVSAEKIAKCRRIVEDYLREQGLAWGPGCMDRIEAFAGGNGGDQEAVQACVQQLRAMLGPRRDELPKDVRKCLRRLRRLMDR